MSDQIPSRPFPIYVPAIYPTPRLNFINVSQQVNIIANQTQPVLAPPLLGHVPRIVAPQLPLSTTGGFNTGALTCQQQSCNCMMLLNQQQRERYLLQRQHQQQYQQFRQHCHRERMNLLLHHQQKLEEFRSRYDALSRRVDLGNGIGSQQNVPLPSVRHQPTPSPPDEASAPVVPSNRRHIFTVAENALLGTYYAKCKYPSRQVLALLSNKLAITESKIRDWFTRQRMKEREIEEELEKIEEIVKRRAGANGY